MPSSAIVAAARARGALPAGYYRAFALGPGGLQRHHDFPTLNEAHAYADDVASEADDEPWLAYVLDDRFRIVARGKHYAAK